MISFNFLRPEFFDIFGLAVFSFIIILSLWGLITKKKLPEWSLITLLIIGILGIFIDGAIVFLTYF